jgi:D-aminoacyl-tRNA deacylase
LRAVLQRVTAASVVTEGETVGEIGAGLAVLLGITHDDTPLCAEKLAQKIARMRIFTDIETDKLSRSVLDIGGGVLVVSNFTLYGNCVKGNRPDFTAAAGAEAARALYLHFIDEFIKAGVGNCQSGRFGADMQLLLQCDGPVTILLDTDTLRF